MGVVTAPRKATVFRHIEFLRLGERRVLVILVSPDGRFVYASLNGADAVAKVDMTSRKLVGTVAVGDGPIQTYVSGDNRYLLVANQGTEDSPGTAVSVIDCPQTSMPPTASR